MELNGSEQTLSSSNFLDGFILQILQTIVQDLSELQRIFNHAFVNEDLNGSSGDSRAKRITTISGTVLTRLDLVHDFFVGKDNGNGVNTAGSGLSEEKHVGLDVFPLASVELTGSAETSLNFIADKQNIILGTKFSDLLQVAFLREDDTSLTLNGFNHKGGDVGVLLEFSFQSLDIIEGDDFKAEAAERSESSVSIGIVTGGAGSDGSSPEVVAGEKGDSSIIRDLLDIVCPSSGELNGTFAGFDTSIHQ